MSSNIRFNFATPVPREVWEEFCAAHRIEYSPATFGKNIFYAGGIHGVQIEFGEAVYTHLPDAASSMVIGTYFMGNLMAVKKVARQIKRTFRCRTSADSELQGWWHGREDATARVFTGGTC